MCIKKNTTWKYLDTEDSPRGKHQFFSFSEGFFFKKINIQFPQNNTIFKKVHTHLGLCGTVLQYDIEFVKS